MLESKFEQKRRALKEIEMSLGKQLGDLEKKNSGLMAHIERLEEERKIIEENHQEETMSLQSQIQALDSSAGAAYYYGSAHAEDVMKYKGQLQALESTLADL